MPRGKGKGEIHKTLRQIYIFAYIYTSTDGYRKRNRQREIDEDEWPVSTREKLESTEGVRRGLLKSDTIEYDAQARGR